ncbi:hypothetical protein [Nocardioides humi]|uniref:Uncharacterized protein n=1 Tax=Nocardioides humi TaxID=449461 RepID=A0ABN2ASE7_9ACTN|nr:hypothetical protein [Nocardioides humi]
MRLSAGAGLDGWRDHVVAGVVVLLFLVPAVLLVAGPKPSRLGFQMYSGYGMVTASWEDRSGQLHEVDLAHETASVRTEIDWTAFLPEELCRRLPSAVRVEVGRTQPGGLQRRSVAC